MKKLHKLFIIIGVVLATTLLAYQLLLAGVSTQLFDAMKNRRFTIGMSVARAKSRFSNYAELVETRQTEGEYGKVTILTFTRKDKAIHLETLVLSFIDDELVGFSYDNWDITFGRA